MRYLVVVAVAVGLLALLLAVDGELPPDPELELEELAELAELEELEELAELEELGFLLEE